MYVLATVCRIRAPTVCVLATVCGCHREYEAGLAPDAGILERTKENELMKTLLRALKESVRCGRKGCQSFNQRRPLGGGDTELRLRGQ